MTNLTYIKTLHPIYLPRKNPWEFTSKPMSIRNEWLERQMRKHYSDEEINQVLTNRRSNHTDDALINDFLKTDLLEFTVPKDHHFESAVLAVTNQFRPNRVLHPIHFPDLRGYPKTLSTSAEAPWTIPTFRFKPTGRDVDTEFGQPKLFESQVQELPHVDQHVLVPDYLRLKQSLKLIEDSSTSYHNLYNEILVYNRSLIHQIKEGEHPFWDTEGNPIPYFWNTLHARSHVVSQDEPDKIRSVFGATKLLLDAELPFVWPLQATYLNTQAGRLLWGREMNRGGWRRLFAEMHHTAVPNTVLSIDWSAFDKRMLHELIRIVHSIWRSYFDFTVYEPTSKYPKANPGNPIRLERLWKWTCNAITSTPILLPNGQLFKWNHRSFGSGYQQTQLMDTFVNAIMIYTCLSSLGVNIHSDTFWARFQGDDSLISFIEQMFIIYGNDFLVMMAQSALYYFDALFNTKKSAIQSKVSGISVLSYPNSYGIAYRHDEDLLRHLFFPERPQDFGRLAASVLGLATAALGCSPSFHRLCESIWHKLVIKKQIQPKWKTLKWMVRAGMIETLDQLKTADFPTITYLRSLAYDIKTRTPSEMARQWPTRLLPKGDFFFLNDL